MDHVFGNVTITEDTIEMTVNRSIVMSPGDTMTITFNGDIVPIRKDELNALIAYRDWKVNDDPRGDSEKEDLEPAQAGGWIMVQHACAGWLRSIYAGLLRMF